MITTACTPDRAEAQRFLDLLEPNGDFWFQFAPEAPGATARAGHLHGTLEQHWNTLCQLNLTGAAIWVQINAGRGRKDLDITSVRAYFVDIDKGDGASLLSPDSATDILVESSPGKYHGYWLAGQVPLDDFKARQHALADRFGGDRTVCNLGRVMRLPGFVHQKGDPFVTRIIKVSKEL